jgi:hypothetical protein
MFSTNQSNSHNRGGKLILIELTRPLIRNSLLFGLLPGWWKAQEKWRQWGPIASETEWRSLLSRAGFVDGFDHATRDFDESSHHMSMLVATYGRPEIHQLGLAGL